MKIALLNGPNLDRLGKREPEIYGSTTLEELEVKLRTLAYSLKKELLAFQSNHEGELIDQIYKWADDPQIIGIIFNPGAFTHTSIALRDAISGSGKRFVEVHISNIYRREEFRHKSLTAPVSDGVISGLGLFGYEAALRYFAQ